MTSSGSSLCGRSVGRRLVMVGSMVETWTGAWLLLSLLELSAAGPLDSSSLSGTEIWCLSLSMVKVKMVFFRVVILGLAHWVQDLTWGPLAGLNSPCSRS